MDDPAMSPEDENAGGDGGAELRINEGPHRRDDEYTTSNHKALDRLERRAMAEGWPVPSWEAKRAMVNRQTFIATHPSCSKSEATKAFRALTMTEIQFERIRLALDRVEQSKLLIAIQQNIQDNDGNTVTKLEVAVEYVDDWFYEPEEEEFPNDAIDIAPSPAASASNGDAST